MRNILLLALGLFLSTQAIHAQLPNVSTGALPAGLNAGQLITQLTGALKPTSFTDAWAGGKSGFMGQAQKISNAVSMASTVASLASFVKPSLFKEGSSAAGILQTANKVKTMTDAAGLLKSFEGGLKPEAFTSGWSGQRSSWLSALNLLK
ncbi:MAG: hypothetical protein INR73_21760 [Williamsia sp.]|nr:hypothetical protein [Williamsia sp.]